MELWQVAIPVADVKAARHVLGLLREWQVPMDPCAGDPRYETDESGARSLLVIVTARVQEQLRGAGLSFRVVRDLADVPDPLRYVSARNRYADEVARLRAAKQGR